MPYDTDNFEDISDWINEGDRMKFEEQFPSLINQDVVIPVFDEEGKKWGFNKGTIKEHCLDKQRVKESIEKVITRWETNESLKKHLDWTDLSHIEDEIEEELGLK